MSVPEENINPTPVTAPAEAETSAPTGAEEQAAPTQVTESEPDSSQAQPTTELVAQAEQPESLPVAAAPAAEESESSPTAEIQATEATAAGSAAEPVAAEPAQDAPTETTPAEDAAATETTAAQTAAKSAEPVAKPGVSPAAFAKKKPAAAAPILPVKAEYSAEELAQAEAFGQLSNDGTVFVKDGDSVREVGQFPEGEKETALGLFARRYLDLKSKIELFATRLASPSIKAHEIDESVKNLTKETKEPAVVGDIPALRARLEELKTQAEQKKTELAKAHQAAVEQAIAARTAIVEKAELAVADLDGERTNWRKTAEEFTHFFEDWQKHQQTDARIDKPTADALWKRFSAARSAFNQARRRWAAERDAQREAARAAKEAIIKEAEGLQDSTEWVQTAHAFADLMERWKGIARVGKPQDDALWKRFRAAADHFFDARQADRVQLDASAKDNLVKKEALLVKAEALVPVSNSEEARAARSVLAGIQDEWDAVGRVPYEDMRRLESRLSAVEKQLTAVEEAEWNNTNPDADARKSAFGQQLAAQLADLETQIAAETDPAKKAALEAEKATKQQWLNAVK